MYFTENFTGVGVLFRAAQIIWIILLVYHDIIKRPNIQVALFVCLFVIVCYCLFVLFCFYEKCFVINILANKPSKRWGCFWHLILMDRILFGATVKIPHSVQAMALKQTAEKTLLHKIAK